MKICTDAFVRYFILTIRKAVPSTGHITAYRDIVKLEPFFKMQHALCVGDTHLLFVYTN